ncbi:hypothetical protein [Streptomyces sp. AP-93]|uniref:hypothetical protein n=1 Tax=Streptomyces sp. AP-93 TaxID=2929048 RepID=UPI001FAE960E|nr:hypothetical protein [Streptomyces sp. AP-93]MCJ0875095.1 hypothetical protein [Streptomyces sp. AP-93]
MVLVAAFGPRDAGVGKRLGQGGPPGVPGFDSVQLGRAFGDPLHGRTASFGGGCLAVIRAPDRARAIRVKDAKDFRNAERNEDWSPTDDDLYANTRVQWAEEMVSPVAAWRAT